MTELTGRLRRRAAAEGFTMSSAAEDGRFLTALAARQARRRHPRTRHRHGPGHRVPAGWHERGVTLVTVELSQPLSGIAREEIADPRVEWVIADGGDWLTAAVTREDR